jgi:integral membrane sensor domain MASE1
MTHSRGEQPLARELRQAVCRYRRIALTFAALGGIAALCALVGAERSNRRWIGIYVAAWAGLTAVSFLLAANAFAEDAPIRWFVRRFAFACASVPPVLWLGVHFPDDVGSMLLAGLVVLFFGWRALRYMTF